MNSLLLSRSVFGQPSHEQFVRSLFEKAERYLYKDSADKLLSFVEEQDLRKIGKMGRRGLYEKNIRELAELRQQAFQIEKDFFYSKPLTSYISGLVVFTHQYALEDPLVRLALDGWIIYAETKSLPQYQREISQKMTSWLFRKLTPDLNKLKGSRANPARVLREYEEELPKIKDIVRLRSSSNRSIELKKLYPELSKRKLEKLSFLTNSSEIALDIVGFRNGVRPSRARDLITQARKDRQREASATELARLAIKLAQPSIPK